MTPVAPLLVAAVFATVAVALQAPVQAADSPTRIAASRLFLAGSIAALAAAVLLRVAALRWPAIAGVSMAGADVVGRIAGQALVVALAAVPLAALAQRYWSPPAGNPRPLALAAAIGAVTGTVAATLAGTAPSFAAVVLPTLACGGGLVVAVASAPALRERLDAGLAPAALRGRPLALLSAAIVALAVAATLQALRR